MNDQTIAEIAFTRAWGAYLMINRGIAENDIRRAKLREFICNLSEAGVSEAEPLAVEGLKYLKTLDGAQTG